MIQPDDTITSVQQEGQAATIEACRMQTEQLVLSPAAPARFLNPLAGKDLRANPDRSPPDRAEALRRIDWNAEIF
jgi:hypothetical protein